MPKYFPEGHDAYASRPHSRPMTKDNRCTYRIREERNCRIYDGKWQHKYVAQYKKPNGWFWWDIDYSFSYESAKYYANRHAELRSGVHKKAEPTRLPVFHNLGKLP